MRPFFETTGRGDALREHARTWLGTPFMPHARIKGGGVDCVWLAASIYQESGLGFEFKPGQYTMDASVHNTASQVIDWLEGTPHFIKAAFPPLPGDLLCFRIGQCVHHVGIVLTERTFIHVLRGCATRESRLDDTTWSKRLAAVYRPVEL